MCHILYTHNISAWTVPTRLYAYKYNNNNILMCYSGGGGRYIHALCKRGVELCLYVYQTDGGGVITTASRLLRDNDWLIRAAAYNAKDRGGGKKVSYANDVRTHTHAHAHVHMHAYSARTLQAPGRLGPAQRGTRCARLPHINTTAVCGTNGKTCGHSKDRRT